MVFTYPLSSLGVDGDDDALCKRNRNRLDNRFVAYCDKRPFFRPIRSKSTIESSVHKANEFLDLRPTRAIRYRQRERSLRSGNPLPSRGRNSGGYTVSNISYWVGSTCVNEFRPRSYTAIHRAVPIPCSAPFRRARSRLRRVGTR